MSHHTFRDTADQYMCESCPTMRRRNDQVDIVVFYKRADIQHRRAIGKNRLKFCAPEVNCAYQFPHLTLGTFASRLLQAPNVVERHAVARIDVSEICRMEQNDHGPKFIGKPNRVPQAVPRAIRKIYGDKDCANRKPRSIFRLKSVSARDENWTRRMLYNSLSCAAKEDMFQSCAPMRWHHDKIGRNFLRNSTGFIECRSAAEDMASRQGDAAFARQHVKVFGGIFLRVLLMCHHRKRIHWRCRQKKAGRVIKLTNMGKMN